MPRMISVAAVTIAQSRTDFYFSQELRQQDIISGHVTLANNLCHPEITRQVARKIASVTAP